LSESALFRKFVRFMFHLRSLELVKELESTLEKIDNLKALGESTLVYSKIVSQKLSKKDGPLAAEEKGEVVLEVLKKALKHLQVTGIRSDSDPSWRSYNILSGLQARQSIAYVERDSASLASFASLP
jgi:hypothetical protein